VVFDVVVIGSGVEGLFTSFELARRGFSVAVVDRHPEPGWGVSRRHAGRAPRHPAAVQLLQKPPR